MRESSDGVKIVKAATVNVNSIINKVQYLFNLVEGEGLHVVSVTETWLTDSCGSSFVQIPEFSLHRGDVAGPVRKHGAAIYVSNSLRHVQAEVTIPNVAVVHLTDLNVFVLSVYRPPSYSREENVLLADFIREFSANKEVLLLGDFNLPSLKWSESSVWNSYVTPTDRFFYECFIECGLSQWVSFGTYFPSGNILDLVLSSDEDRVGEIYAAPPLPGCHHCPVICSLVFNFGPDESVSFRPPRLQWARADFGAISAEILETDWEYLFTDLDVESCNNLYVRQLQECIRQHVPVRSAAGSHRWLVRPPRHMVHQRSVLWVDYKTARSTHGRNSGEAEGALSQYLRLNQTYRNFARSQQSEYEQKLANRLATAPKLFHSYLRERKVGCPAVGPLRASDGSLVHENSQMSNEFVSAFSAVFVSTDPAEPHPHEVFDGRMMDIDVTYDAVLSVISSLSETSSPGPDGIHPALLKNCAEAVALPLTLVIRKSLVSGSLPSSWKESRVVPIFKAGPKYMPLNYRPVSMTSCDCKAAERLLAAHIIEYLEQGHILSSRQFGFRKGHSTEDQLLRAYNKIVEEVDKGRMVDAVYLDFSKAFDVLSYNILLAKLRSLGFCQQILKWVESFLRGRSMRVSVGGCDSLAVPVTSGVPQGSVLGPLLFLIYVNSLGNDFNCEWYAFADDLKLYVSYPRDIDSVVGSLLQDDLDLLVERSRSWNLTLNPSKCVVIRFGGRPCGDDVVNSGYRLEDVPLKLVKSHRDLGVLIDSSLKFHMHVSDVVRKSSGLANQILRSTVCRSKEFMVTLFLSHIRPIIDYCSPVWNLGYQGDLNRLEAVQRRWTKQVVGLSTQDYPARLRSLELFSIKGRLLRADLIKVWKIFHPEVDVGLMSIFEREFHGATRGHRMKVSIPVCRSELRRRFFSIRVATLWNSLPAAVVEADSIGGFKSGLEEALGDLFYQV